MSRWLRRLQKDKRVNRRARVLSAAGWTIVLLGFVGFMVNEATVDLPPIHYGMYVVMFLGAYLGFRYLP